MNPLDRAIRRQISEARLLANVMRGLIVLGVLVPTAVVMGLGGSALVAGLQAPELVAGHPQADQWIYGLLTLGLLTLATKAWWYREAWGCWTTVGARYAEDVADIHRAARGVPGYYS